MLGDTVGGVMVYCAGCSHAVFILHYTAFFSLSFFLLRSLYRNEALNSFIYGVPWCCLVYFMRDMMLSIVVS